MPQECAAIEVNFLFFVIPAHEEIQVTDSVRQTVEKRYPGG